MKKLGLILASLILFSCYFENEQEKQEEMENWKDYAVIVIDSCEYIIKSSSAPYQGFGYMAHKGNCKFCKERR